MVWQRRQVQHVFIKLYHIHRRHRVGGYIGVHAVRQVVHQRAVGHQPVHRRRLHSDRDGRFAVVPVVPGMCGRRQGSQMHAFNVFHNIVHNIHCDARRRDIVLRIPPEGADDHATRDAADHKILWGRPCHN